MSRQGRDLVLEILATEDVRHVFGNPGTTEMPLVDALSRQGGIEFVLALQESSVIGIADGYAQVTGRPALVNLHAAGGLGNAMGNITNARANHAPLVVTAGQQDLRHLVADPLLSGDLVSMPRSWAKSSHEARSVPELATLLRRAFKDAGTAPMGPAFLSMPMNLLDEGCDAPAPPRSCLRTASAADDVGELLDRLVATPPGRLAFVMGDEAHAADPGVLVRLVETLGATVLGAPLFGRLAFPTDHPAWAGSLAFAADRIREALARFERIVFFGDQAFLVYHYADCSPVPDGADFIHVGADAGQLGRTHATSLGVLADPATVIRQLAAAVDGRTTPSRRAEAGRWLADIAAARRERDARQARSLAERSGRTPMDPMCAVHAAMAALPRDALVVDEAVTASPYVRGFYRGRPAGFLASRGGGLGWAMPAAIGASLGAGRAPTVAMVGDGSAMYSPQALWSAANLGLPVVFVIVDNREYRILKQYGAKTYGVPDGPRRRGFVGLDIGEPAVDFVALAAAMGVPGTRAETERDVGDAVRAAFAAGGPALVEMTVAG